jgi:hypothetical protein
MDRPGLDKPTGVCRLPTAYHSGVRQIDVDAAPSVDKGNKMKTAILLMLSFSFWTALSAGAAEAKGDAESTEEKVS